MGSPLETLYRDIVSASRFYSDAASAYIEIGPDRMMSLFEARVSPVLKLPTRLYAIRANPETRPPAYLLYRSDPIRVCKSNRCDQVVAMKHVRLKIDLIWRRM